MLHKNPTIHIRNVSKSFGSHKVLTDVNIEIEANKTTAILGPSGTGKSVLLKLIIGLLEPEKGEIAIDDLILNTANENTRKELRKSIGMLFQNAALFDSLSIFENISFPLEQLDRYSSKEIFEKTNVYISKVGLEKFAHLLPGQVSIGIRKRAGIARAMITEPKIILFDEPNTGLDPLVGQDIYDLINFVRKEKSFTGIIVSHEIPEVFQCCDKVIMLYGGNVQFSGSIDDFLAIQNPIVHQFIHGLTKGPIQISS